MHGIDPYEPTDPIFECTSCGARTESRGACPDCDGTMRNIAVPRE